MEKNYRIIELEQGSEAWRLWRHDGISATDAPIIMGENPYKDIDQLLRTKVASHKKEYIRNEMRRGLLLEPDARESYNKHYNRDVKPACIQSNTLTWLKASLDGLSSDMNCVTEIKCGEAAYKRVVKHNKVPTIYYGQLQHILAITDLSSIDFFCYLPGKPTALIKVERDDAYISTLLEREERFWNLVKSYK